MGEYGTKVDRKGNIIKAVTPPTLIEQKVRRDGKLVKKVEGVGLKRKGSNRGKQR